MAKEIPLTQGKVALVDDEDYERVMAAGPWHAHFASGKWYAIHSVNSRTKCWMHRLIAEPHEDQEIDHIDGDGLRNVKTNLRTCSHPQNGGNRAKQSAQSSSSFKGVCWNARRRRWQAGIQVDGESHHLGYFTGEADAARAYDEAAKLRFGEFAKLNLPQC
jgi:hypothetical protein